MLLEAAATADADKVDRHQHKETDHDKDRYACPDDNSLMEKHTVNMQRKTGALHLLAKLRPLVLKARQALENGHP